MGLVIYDGADDNGNEMELRFDGEPARMAEARVKGKIIFLLQPEKSWYGHLFSFLSFANVAHLCRKCWSVSYLRVKIL